MHHLPRLHRDLSGGCNHRGGRVSIHPIEQESYRIMRAEIDFSAWRGADRAVVERMVHATADPDYATTTVVGRHAVEQALAALVAGASIIVDAQMVRLGITGQASRCYLDEIGTVEPSMSVTRSALAIRMGALAHADGAIFVIGNAPTALFELIALAESGQVRPAAVLGLPVGFVGAAESKEALRNSVLAPYSVTNVGRKGGSAVAAGAMNALLRLATPA
jgi:precorrin-8X/cobalt-precorrin-8 methylmutase